MRDCLPSRRRGWQVRGGWWYVFHGEAWTLFFVSKEVSKNKKLKTVNLFSITLHRSRYECCVAHFPIFKWLQWSFRKIINNSTSHLEVFRNLFKKNSHKKFQSSKIWNFYSYIQGDVPCLWWFFRKTCRLWAWIYNWG